MLKAESCPDKASLTKAGRALEKHGSRPNSVFPRAMGDAAAKSAQGQQILENILSSQNQIIEPNKFGGFDYFDLDTGQGARFNGNGNMMGFLQPPR